MPRVPKYGSRKRRRQEQVCNDVTPEGIDEESSTVEREVEPDASWRMELDDDIQTGNDAGPPEETMNDELFTQSTLYSVAKPLIDLINKSVNNLITKGHNGAVNPRNKWGMERKRQFLEHVFRRVRLLLSVAIDSTDTSLDTSMIESAIVYLQHLQMRVTNFRDNEYVKLHVLEALMPNSFKSQRAIATRLDININLMPEIVAKRLKFNELID
jgi:hypothetical protein